MSAVDEVVRHREVEVAGGVRLHVAEAGPEDGELVVLLHGFPECWYSWRHQLVELAAAGYRVVAPDQRGYGRSSAPEAVEDYSLLHLAGDVIALIGELGERRAAVVGHDWGAPVAWVTAMLRPDVVRGVAGLSVPPVLPAGMAPPSVTSKVYGERFYQVYFQEPGRADEELARDPRATFRSVLFAGSGDFPRSGPPRPWVLPEGKGLAETFRQPEALPDWLTEEDIEVFVREFAHHGDRAFTGPLNWYRNIERNQALTAAFRGLRIEVPGLFVGGDRDMVMGFRGMDRLLENLESVVPQLRGKTVLPGCGHWTQQERPKEVNAALVEFLRGLA